MSKFVSLTPVQLRTAKWATTLILAACIGVGWWSAVTIQGEGTWIIGVLFGVFTAITIGATWRAASCKTWLHYVAATGMVLALFCMEISLHQRGPQKLYNNLAFFGVFLMATKGGAAEVWYEHRKKQMALRQQGQSSNAVP